MIPLLTLPQMQQWFLGLLLHPGSDEQAVSAQQSLVAPAALHQVLRPSLQQSAWQRLHIYRHSYLARLHECLQDDFAALRYAVGEKLFDSWCTAYIQQQPSRHANLNLFGEHFPKFVRAQSGASPFAAELAELEWAVLDVVHAASTSLPAHELAQVPAAELGQLRFQTNDAVRLLSFLHPVNAYFKAYLNDHDPAWPAPEQTELLVVRSGTAVVRLELDSRQAQVLRKLHHGAPLCEALAGIALEPHELQCWFSQWTQLSVFSAASTAARA